MMLRWRTYSSTWLRRWSSCGAARKAILTAFTGARTKVIWFKVCPVLLTTTAGLLVVASIV
jgi:hypothetical protein